MALIKNKIVMGNGDKVVSTRINTRTNRMSVIITNHSKRFDVGQDIADKDYFKTLRGVDAEIEFKSLHALDNFIDILETARDFWVPFP